MPPIAPRRSRACSPARSSPTRPAPPPPGCWSRRRCPPPWHWRPPCGFPAARQPVPMLARENAFTDSDLADFLEQINRFLGRKADQPLTRTAEPKLAGLSMTIRYEGGAMVVAATRGDGVSGEAVT